MHNLLFICADKLATVSLQVPLVRKSRTLTVSCAVNEGSCPPGGFIMELKADGTFINHNETIPPHVQVNKQSQ